MLSSEDHGAKTKDKEKGKHFLGRSIMVSSDTPIFPRCYGCRSSKMVAIIDYCYILAVKLVHVPIASLF